MCIICRHEVTDHLSVVDCSGCVSVTEIPYLCNVTELYANNCPELRSIPSLPRLIRLRCTNCPKLYRIPTQPNVVSITCCNNPRLLQIAYQPSLKHLISINCITLWDVRLPTWCSIRAKHSPFMLPPLKIECLATLQRWIRRMLLMRRIVRLTRDKGFLQAWFHPQCKGGYFDKKRMGSEIDHSSIEILF